MLAIDRGCKCEKCAFHQNEARVKRLASATEWHRRFHRQYGIPWDPSKCPTCESKGTGDQP